MLQIDTMGRVIINGQATGHHLAQRAEGTIIYTPESRHTGIQYKEHPMPSVRYSTAHDAPASGVAGRSELERDVLALLRRLGAAV